MSTTAFELSGIVHSIDEEKSFASGFRKREFVIETIDDKYPQKIKLEAVKDLCDALDLYEDGDPIEVSFNIRGNEYNGKFYVNLQAWKLDRGQGKSSAGNQSRPAARTATPKTPTDQEDWGDDDDDIPF